MFVREVYSHSGRIDLVGIGSSGSITVMECKRANNLQIKREVVGQVLDYAGSLWERPLEWLVSAFGGHPFEELRAKVEADGGEFKRCAAPKSRDASQRAISGLVIPSTTSTRT